MHVHKRITVERPRDQVYAFWRNLTQLPQFMDHLASVQGDTEGVTHWRAKGPAGSVEWDAEMVEDKPNELIIGGPMMASPGFSSTGLIGATDPAEAGVIGATRGSVPGADSDLANDVDPDQLGLRRGHDQNKFDPNDRDLGNPDAPEHDIGYRPSGAPI